MDENDVVLESSPETETGEASPIVEETTVATPEMVASSEVEEKVVPYKRFKEVNDELVRLKSQPRPEVKGDLAVEDFIDISAALDGLDPREKARLAEEHKLSGKPLKQIRESEDYQLWQTAYRMKLEKENALKPSSTQAVEEQPKSAGQRIAAAKTLAEKEAVLKELGLWKENRPRADKVTIGLPRSL